MSLGKGGVNAWAAVHVLKALNNNPSHPVQIPTHGTTNRRHFRPSYGLDEAVEDAFRDLFTEEEHRKSHETFGRILNWGSKDKGPLPRTAAVFADPDADIDPEDVRKALVKDLIASMALDSEEVRDELDRRQRACTNHTD